MSCWYCRADPAIYTDWGTCMICGRAKARSASVKRNPPGEGALIINRVWAMPNRWTFQIPPIAELVARYVGDGKGWIDPFAGQTSPAEFTNDLNRTANAKSHLDALDFLRGLCGQYKGIIFDPPYSYQQMKECYEEIGTGAITSRHATNFYGDLRDTIAPLIQPGGLALSFGWNSIGMGKTHGFKLLEILLVCHGRAHNDTICTVEQKVQAHLITSLLIPSNPPGRGT